MQRRAFLQIGAAAAGTAVTAPYIHAQTRKFAGITLRVNSWGGLFEEAITKNVSAPLLEKYGLKVEVVRGALASQLIKLISQKDEPEVDLFMGDSSVMPDLIKGGVTEEIKESDVAGLKRILSDFREFGDHGVPFSLAAQGVGYNPDSIKQPLTSYSDLARPDLKGKVVLFPATTPTSSLYLLGWAQENGGSVTDMEPAWKILEATKPNLVAVAQGQIPQMQMYQSKEVQAGPFWNSAYFELKGKGFPIEFVVPSKGICGALTYMNLIKGTKHPEAAYAFLEQILSDQGQRALPETVGYEPTTDVKLPNGLRKRLVFASPERAALRLKVDWEKWSAGHSARIERFNKIIAA
ncbi:extracellular solute-binding protein [Bradyrhizobium sp. SSUT77]|uniref:extracellular solute-binding protein n=1 Tax=Bradyrhizobium sp. SSUT77 TaxID=3040603 RepID=UPI00244D0BF8|nr:extracellular solute-binding protein [Bradyrhizobium sp. SSUT77]MDH2348364.1 extracellular solute-binding protein [Bradyrhizobium sp. SSUT77]